MITSDEVRQHLQHANMPSKSLFAVLHYTTQQEKITKLHKLEKQARMLLVEIMNNPTDTQIKNDYFLIIYEIGRVEEELENESI